MCDAQWPKLRKVLVLVLFLSEDATFMVTASLFSIHLLIALCAWPAPVRRKRLPRSQRRRLCRRQTAGTGATRPRERVWVRNPTTHLKTQRRTDGTESGRRTNQKGPPRDKTVKQLEQATIVSDFLTPLRFLNHNSLSININ
eukprot:6254979-Amphidinium_carterae.2